jgi:hypothetical protein
MVVTMRDFIAPVYAFSPFPASLGSCVWFAQVCSLLQLLLLMFASSRCFYCLLFFVAAISHKGWRLDRRRWRARVVCANISNGGLRDVSPPRQQRRHQLEAVGVSRSGLQRRPLRCHGPHGLPARSRALFRSLRYRLKRNGGVTPTLAFLGARTQAGYFF